MNTDIQGKIRVEIVGDHPHSGRTGYLKGKRVQLHCGTEMWEVMFSNGDECLAEMGNIIVKRSRRTKPNEHSIRNM